MSYYASRVIIMFGHNNLFLQLLITIITTIQELLLINKIISFKINSVSATTVSFFCYAAFVTLKMAASLAKFLRTLKA